MGEHLGTAPMLNLKLGTHVNRVAVVDLSGASRMFLCVLRFGFLETVDVVVFLLKYFSNSYMYIND